MNIVRLLLSITLLLLLASCGGGGSGSSTTPSYTVSVTTTGLGSGQQVSLLLNGSNNLLVTANGTSTFNSVVQQSANYAVTVGTQPSGQICTVSNAMGSNVSANVNGVSVYCVNITTINFAVNNQFQFNGSAGTATIQFSNGSNANVWVYSRPNEFALDTSVTTSCLAGNIPASCVPSLSSQSFTTTNTLVPTSNSFIAIKGTNNQYFLINFLNSTRKLDGNSTDSVSFVWYSTDATTVGSMLSTFGPYQQGYNKTGNSTVLNFLNSGTLTLDLDVQNILNLTNSDGRAIVSFTPGSTGDSNILAYPSLVTDYTTFVPDCSVTSGNPNCRINLENYIFASNSINMPTGRYALVWGENNQYFLIHFDNPQRIIDGDSINGLTLTWYSTSSTTTISISQRQ